MKDAILNYINADTTGALMITGPWGCGKTYHFKNQMIPYIITKGYNPILVSLFGVSELSELPGRIYSTYLNNASDDRYEIFYKKENQQREEKKSFLGKIKGNVNSKNGVDLLYHSNVQRIFEWVDAIPFVKNFVDPKKLFSQGMGLFNYLPPKTIICFDDYERMSSEIRREDLLGVINALIENFQKKVIVIAHEEEVFADRKVEKNDKEKGIKFKEKVFERTIGYNPDIEDIFFQIVEEKKDDTFKKFMRETPLVRRTLNITDKVDHEKTFDTLAKDLSNLRSLKYAINQFEVIFQSLLEVDNKVIEESDILSNIWCFVLAISIESRLNRISYYNRMRLDNYDTTYAKAAELMRYMNKNREAKDSKDITDPIVYDRFFEFTYFIRHHQRLYYNESIFNFLTNGDSLDGVSILGEWRKEFYRDELSPSMALFRQFMADTLGFTDEEFPAKLTELLGYTREGNFDSIRDLFNAASILVKYREYFGKSEQQIKDTIKEGINSFIDKSPKPDPFFGYPQKITRSRQTDQDLISDLYEYADKLMKQRYEAEIDSQIKEFEKLFVKNLEEFVDRVIPNPENYNPPFRHIPFLHKFSDKTIGYHVDNITPCKVRFLDTLVYGRYLEEGNYISLKEEQAFLIQLKTYLEKLDLNKNVLSVGYIKENLIPNIDKAVSSMNIESDSK